MPAPRHVQHRCPLAGHPRAAQARPPPPPPGEPLIPALPARRSPTAPARLPPHDPAPRTTRVSGGDQGRTARPPAPVIPGRPAALPPHLPWYRWRRIWRLSLGFPSAQRHLPPNHSSGGGGRGRKGARPPAHTTARGRTPSRRGPTHGACSAAAAVVAAGAPALPASGPSPRLPAARPRLLPGAGRSRCLRARACLRSHPPHTPPSALRNGLR